MSTSQLLAASHASIQSLYTSTGSERSGGGGGGGGGERIEGGNEYPVECMDHHSPTLTVDWGLKVFRAHLAHDHSCVPYSVPEGGEKKSVKIKCPFHVWRDQLLYSHFNLARLLMVAEWAGEQCVQRSRQLLFRRRFPFGLPSPHDNACKLLYLLPPFYNNVIIINEKLIIT